MLKEINLSFWQIDDASFETLTNFLSEHKNIRKIDLAHNDLTNRAGKSLKEIFEKNKIKTFDISHNENFGDSGLKKISQALKKSKYLQKLSFRFCRIGLTGELAKILEENRFVKKILV